MSEKPFVIATRKSQLALRQSEMAGEHFAKHLPDAGFELLKMVTTGDKKTHWSLEDRGGKGLFTKELEEALLDGRADLAVHSAKDLPTEMPEGLALAGFLPRAPTNDVLVVRRGVTMPRLIATGSPRRRCQAKALFPEVEWAEIRGNVETRLRKIAEGQADATILAQAGLLRLGLLKADGVVLKPFPIDTMIPAAGQGAIAIQCRSEDVSRFSANLDAVTAYAVEIERKFLALMGGGCHSAMAAHFVAGRLLVFHEDYGRGVFRGVGGLRGKDLDDRLHDCHEELKSVKP